jgi:polysaccharide biosynthesis/export protein
VLTKALKTDIARSLNKIQSLLNLATVLSQWIMLKHRITYHHKLLPIVGRIVLMPIVLLVAMAIPAVAEIAVNRVTPYQDIGANPSEDAYTLGAGDLVKVDIFDTPELKLEERYTVLVDGSLNLPWVGTVNVRGLTLSEAADVLALRYAQFIQKPLITLNSVSPRPLKIAVLGEVNRPGAYIISPIAGSETSRTNLSDRTSSNTGSQWPTVTKAVQTAGGITQLANVRKIQVRRPQRGGTDKVMDLDLWKFLQAGEQDQDITLRDGDSIIIPLATNLNPAEATEIATSNFSPETIKVSVVGEVTTPGQVAVTPNTSLNQAVLVAGGFKSGRSLRRDVELIRLNPNGTVSRRGIAIDFSKDLDEATNPALRNNDIIVVKPTALARTSDFLSLLFSPITGTLGVLRLLGF